MYFKFDNSYLNLDKKLFSYEKLNKIKNPKLLLFNEEVAKKLNIVQNKDLIDILSGNKELKNTISQAYAGHQFGYFNILGDGRAVLIGEHINHKNQRFDIQIKGSGVTRYSRSGDGKLTVSSALREYIYSYALEKLHIKSSSSLAIILTDDFAYREEIEETAFLVRVMESHIRVGTFEYVANFCSFEELKNFVDYVINRHFINIENKKNKYILFFEKVMQNLITMVINWYRVGFIHGVMNTDNMSITGTTFDFGPCSFLNSYEPKTTFSIIDTQKRYSFENQKKNLKFNLIVFAKTLIPLIDKDQKRAIKILNKKLDEFEKIFEEKFYQMMKKKLGINENILCKDLIDEFLLFMEKNELDYTNTFIELEQPNSFEDLLYKQKDFLMFRKKFLKIGLDTNLMKKNNPKIILRNYLIEKAIEEYKKEKKLDLFIDLLKNLKNPYKIDKINKKYQNPPKKQYDKNYFTHCNT